MQVERSVLPNITADASPQISRVHHVDGPCRYIAYALYIYIYIYFTQHIEV